MTDTRVTVAERSRVFAFDHDHGVPPRSLAGLLGGKGSGLAEMTSVLGLPVPPGFTITTPTCLEHQRTGWPAELDEVLVDECHRIGAQLGRRLGDPEAPLLLSVRSGSARSMPGMLDTILDLGLNDDTVEGLVRWSGDASFAWDSYRRFLRMYAVTVLGCDDARLDVAAPDPGPAQIAAMRSAIVRETGRDVPTDPLAQLRDAVVAVFRSWDSPRATVYRTREGIPHDLGTAVNIQAMVFGNLGSDSGTGVVFSRDPSTGRARPYGDFLVCAQGEDVVAGGSRTVPVSDMAELMPPAWNDLSRVLRALEVHYRDICDVEFTVERGRLFVLQTRVGTRSAVAAVRSAVQMAADPDIGLTRAEAVERVGADVREAAARHCLAEAGFGAASSTPFTTGLGASPGRASGVAVFSSEEAAEDEGDDPIVLVRPDTSPDDVAGMAAAAGVLTASGGLVSHAAVVARGWGIPAVVGAHALAVTERGAVLTDGRTIAPGDLITIDGTTGEVWLGATSVAELDEQAADRALAHALPELAVLTSWADTERRHP